MRPLVVIVGVILLIGATAPPAWADCSYGGRLYPVGTRLGPLTCMPDGTWR